LLVSLPADGVSAMPDGKGRDEKELRKGNRKRTKKRETE
jgi:hypothetical protein